MFGSSGGDSGQLLYVPLWSKTLILAVLGLATGVGLYIAVSFVGVPERTDWIIIAMSSAQIAATGLIIAIVILFSESDANIGRLEFRSDQFLKRHVKKALSRITVPGTDAATLTATDVGEKDIFGNLFLLEGANGFRFKLWVGLNVYRIFVIYFVDSAGKDANYTDRLRDIFQFTFGGAEKIGFHTFYERAQPDGEDVVSIWMSATVKETFLTSPTEKLFWAQDVAMMTQSFLRTAVRYRKDVKITTKVDPGPL
jgi:hypothetical protein